MTRYGMGAGAADGIAVYGELRPDQAQNYSIETPYPGDHAPYKVVYTSPWNGGRSIVFSAMTEERARQALERFLGEA
jgi:hypothetical protein